MKQDTNTVFAEFTGNYSRQLNIALCRGAATVQDKNWGVMITWMYSQPPYMESGSALYNDMLLAYENGAEYIVVFDANMNFTENVLMQSQLNAMKELWQYAHANPRTETSAGDRAAYVLPEDYAYGFRGPEDKIWGLWPPDSLTVDISMSVSTLLQMDGSGLDIVYPSQMLTSAGYQSIVYWNSTSLIPDMPTITSPSPVTDDTPHSTTSSRSQDAFLFPFVTTIDLYAILASFLVAVVVAVTILKFKKKRRIPIMTSLSLTSALRLRRLL